MQNEITELRNQVRTLKRIVYGFGCLLVAGIVVGATSLQTVPDEGNYANREIERTIVSFRVTNITREEATSVGASNPTSVILLTRMWSDGTVEMNIVGNETIPDGVDEHLFELYADSDFFTGWKLVTDSVAGYSRGGDTDGNR